jgi:maltose alpha-D-glucosyltransferase/alpha-amylase
MGEDLSLNERDSVRTPMQWANALNGGFPTAPPYSTPADSVPTRPFCPSYRAANLGMSA